MLSLRLAVVSGALVLATACGGSYSSSTPASPTPSPSPSPSPSPTPSPAPAPGGTPSTVAIPVGAASLGTAAFMPDQLSVAVGETVTWTNTDAVAHTSTSDAAGWDSGIVAPGGHFSSTFQTAGTFSYHCAIHPGMVGTVVVH